MAVVTERHARVKLPTEADADRVEASLSYLADKRDFIKKFASIEDFAIEGVETDERHGTGVEYHLRVVRNSVARELWKRDIFIGISVIDHLAFEFARRGDGDKLVSSILEEIRSRRLYRSGFVLYPLHSFGVFGLGLFKFAQRGAVNVTSMVLGDSGVGITAQTNSMNGTFSFLEDVRCRFRIRKCIPRDLVEHFVRSRSLAWVKRNPLLAIHIRSFTGDYYENQFVYILKLRLRTAMIMMLAALERHTETNPIMWLGSTRAVNNFQTLDIRHYLTFETTPGGRKNMLARCVPMNATLVEMARLSDLNVQVDPKYWMSKRAARRLGQLASAISTVEKGYLTYVVAERSETVRSRVFRKLVLSLQSFRRSYVSGFKSSESIIALAVAFETLLTDSYAPGVITRIRDRVRRCLVGVRGTRKYQSAVHDLYACRSRAVHQGVTVKFDDMELAREAYVLCFQAVVSRLNRLPGTSAAPIDEILGVRPGRSSN